MESFAYQVRDQSGLLITGVLEAESPQSVVVSLRERGYFIVNIEAERGSIWQKDVRQIDWANWKRVHTRELAVFCRQFATMINAGIPLLPCLQILQQQTDRGKLKDTVAEVIKELEGGKTLTESLARFPRVFPPLFTNMIEAGEVAGVLDEVLERLAAHYEKDHEIQEKVKSALTYPAVVLVIAILAVGFLLAFVLPTFAGLLRDMNAPMPLLTRLIMAVSGGLRRYWWAVLGVCAGLAFLIQRFAATERGRTLLDHISLRLPIFGKLIRKMIVSRFTRTLGTLLRTGVPILQALEVVKKTAANSVVTAAVVGAQESIRDGRGIAGPLESCRVFPPMVIQMIRVGEETGALDSLLERISGFYDREVDTMVERLSTILEPMLVVGVGLIVGIIIISILLPMFSILGAIQ